MDRDYDAWLAFLGERGAMPFAWGSNDCVTFAAGAAEALTRRNPLAGFDHSWTTERGAKLALTKAGGLEAAADALLPRVPSSMAQRGDVALVRSEAGELLAVVEGATLVAPGPAGLKHLPRSAAVIVWSVA